MADYRLYRFFDQPPPSYREAIQQAIRHFLQTHRRLPTAIVVGTARLDEARQAMSAINADLVKAGLTQDPIPLEVVGGCLWWEVGLGLPVQRMSVAQRTSVAEKGHGGHE